jgi:thiol-disulfide isomerase/thioredoxin
MIKRNLILVIIVILVASVAVVRIARLRGKERLSPVRRATATKANVAVTLSDFPSDTLIGAANAPAAPGFAAGTWINSDPLTLEKLRGRTVLIEFWTFGCYNCRNTLPAVKEWDAKYRDRGLTIVGVHTPETYSEYNLDNVRREIPSLEIKYPVLTDNDYKTWKAYNVEAWPTIFVVDKQGRIRWVHMGEGRYEETEDVIKNLLSE